MRVFFSGTDQKELEQNSEFHNFYLSLIVNNFSEFVCKMAMRGFSDFEGVADIKARDESGNIYIYGQQPITYKKQIVYEMNCEIIGETLSVEVEDPFRRRLDNLLSEKKVKEEKSRQSKAVTTKEQFWPERFPSGEHKNKFKKDKRDRFSPASLIRDDMFSDRDIFQESKKQGLIEDFCTCLLRFGVIIPNDNLESVLEDLSNLKEKENLGSSVLTTYNKVFDHFFADLSGPKDYGRFLENVIRCLEDYQPKYQFLFGVVKALQTLLIRYESIMSDEKYSFH